MLYPVIMCGGAGTRLWPASRPSRPKQFIPLAGNRSLFQETVLRVAALAEDGGALIIVGGVAHRAWIADQLLEINVQAQVLLEPEPRDSAAAMAAAAAWTHKRNPDGVNAFVASDHHIPDDAAFRTAIIEAAEDARRGRIVTLGVRPTEPSSAYGYIQPSHAGLSPVEAFVEKPDAETAARYIEAGYLWNSGNFITLAATLLDELRTHAPLVESAVQAALPDSEGSAVHTLTSAFSNAPKISIDYAVMEKTRRAAVLPVDFAWSDLGAWDAILGTGEGGVGIHILEDSDGCLVRAPDGVLVAALGVSNLAIIAEADAVLVCDISRAQEVKRVVDRIRAIAPQYLDFNRPAPESLESGAARFADWMRLRALPLWATIGQQESGAFLEAVSLDGRAFPSVRRTRVQARQIQVFAQAGLLGWAGPWRTHVTTGLECLFKSYRRNDGLFRTLLAADGGPLDETAMVYDQAFVLLALATATTAGVTHPDIDQTATTIRLHLMSTVLPNGALIEAGPHPYQANAHMHLLEACLAWEDAGGDSGWTDLSDRLVALARSVFIDAEGFVREFFAPDWSAAPGEDGGLVEPGHQFEWAWLLARYAARRGDEAVRADAECLYRWGMKGIAASRQVAVDAMNKDGSIRSDRARLWPQTEWAKAALILSNTTTDGARANFLMDAASAQRAIWRYLTPDGLWQDKMTTDGSFIDEPAPASSLYHLMGVVGQVSATTNTAGLRGLDAKPLA